MYGSKRIQCFGCHYPFFKAPEYKSTKLCSVSSSVVQSTTWCVSVMLLWMGVIEVYQWLQYSNFQKQWPQTSPCCPVWSFMLKSCEKRLTCMYCKKIFFLHKVKKKGYVLDKLIDSPNNNGAGHVTKYSTLQKQLATSSRQTSWECEHKMSLF